MPVALIDRGGVARIAGVAKTTVDDWYRRGEMPPVFATVNGRPLWRVEVIETMLLNRRPALRRTG